MDTFLSEIINAVKNSDYTLITILLILLIALSAFKTFQKIIASKKEKEEKRNDEYKQLLISLLKMPQEEFQFSECYELLKYSRNQSNYDKINRCIIENDLSRIIKYIKSELNLIQGKSFSRFSGPDSGLKLTVYIFRAFKIGDYFIMPLILTIFLLLSIGLLFPVIVMPESNSQYLWLIIALIILAICIIVSYSIIFTDRYIFIPLYKKALYFFPVIAFPFEVVLPYFVCMVVSVAVYGKIEMQKKGSKSA